VTNTPSLDDLYKSVAHEWRLLASVVVVFLIMSFGLSVLWPVRYAATAVLTVEPLSAQMGSTADSVNMDTERVVATSTEVLTLAAKKLHCLSPAELRATIEVNVPKASQVLEFTSTMASADQAAASANAVATAYTDHRVATAEKAVSTATDNLTKRIADLTTQIAALPESSSVARALQVQVEALQERQAALAATTFYSGSLVSPASAPSTSTKPPLAVFLAAGLFLGLFLGAFAALIRGSRVRRIAAELAGTDRHDSG
jgi:uncharacterized protein involved in exopolysaccharide biosynthesis